MAEPRRAHAWRALALITLVSAAAVWLQLRALRPAPIVVPRVVWILPPPPPGVQLWLSTADRKLQLAHQPDVPFAAQAPAHADIVIDTDRRFQSIVGFGAALTDASAWLLRNRLSEQQQAALLRELFGPPPGLNFNMLRLTIGASDFSLKPYTLDDLPRGGTDTELQHFNVAENLRDVIPTTREILAINPHIQIVASPWSAPAWMKSGNTLIGGALLEEYEPTFAAYLARYVDTYRSYGIPIFALTLQNEPNFLPKTYPGMELTAEARTRIISQYLGPMLAGRKPHTVILGWDHNWDELQQPLSVLGDPDAAGYMAGTAWHCYRGTPAAQSDVHRAYPDKDIYVTECSGGDWASAQHGELMWFARDLLLGSLRHWARGVIYWNLILDQTHGPHFGGCDLCKGILLVDTKTGAISRNDEYYAFAHYSRFVLPDAVRVWSTATGDGLANVAFRNPDGSLVLVAINSNHAPRAISVRAGQTAFSYTLPAQSVATFGWNTASLPPAQPKPPALPRP
ncbi:MAG: glycosyl hydrolase [Rhodanobacter sp.]|nr:MAG: glycosyl hydrolase [Rhodanobacter sp.]TAM13953.1 MAG: glycosyl hydrolase [Rhodanobacter sp.]TAM37795.1 MAG: glycosyl hydrolase [Rhodanobacter sp.]